MEILLGMAYAVVGAVAGGLVFASFIARIVLWVRYSKSNKAKLHNGITGAEAARMLLDSKGMQDVEVKKNNWLVSLLWGNHYSVRKKRIGLRGNIYNKNSITSVGVACQKVGLAVMDKEGNKSVKVRGILNPIVMFTPYLFIPLVIIGLVADIVFFHTIGLMSLIFLGVSLLLLIGVLVYTILTYKLEKRGNKQAIEYIKEAGFMDEKDIEEIQTVFRTFEIAYLLDVLASIAQIIKVILELFLKVFKSGQRSKK